MLSQEKAIALRHPAHDARWDWWIHAEAFVDDSLHVLELLHADHVDVVFRGKRPPDFVVQLLQSTCMCGKVVSDSRKRSCSSLRSRDDQS